MGSWESFSFILRMREIAHLCDERYTHFREGIIDSIGEGGNSCTSQVLSRNIGMGSKIELEGLFYTESGAGRSVDTDRGVLVGLRREVLSQRHPISSIE